MCLESTPCERSKFESRLAIHKIPLGMQTTMLPWVLMVQVTDWLRCQNQLLFLLNGLPSRGTTQKHVPRKPYVCVDIHTYSVHGT